MLHLNSRVYVLTADLYSRLMFLSRTAGRNNIFGEDVNRGRDLMECQTWFFELTTDNYAFETSWELQKNNQVMIFGPPPGY